MGDLVQNLNIGKRVLYSLYETIKLSHDFNTDQQVPVRHEMQSIKISIFHEILQTHK